MGLYCKFNTSVIKKKGFAPLKSIISPRSREKWTEEDKRWRGKKTKLWTDNLVRQMNMRWQSSMWSAQLPKGQLSLRTWMSWRISALGSGWLSRRQKDVTQTWQKALTCPRCHPEVSFYYQDHAVTIKSTDCLKICCWLNNANVLITVKVRWNGYRNDVISDKNKKEKEIKLASKYND